jgi:hypothetical protein
VDETARPSAVHLYEICAGAAPGERNPGADEHRLVEIGEALG